MDKDSLSDKRQREKKSPQCQMKTYGGFFFMAGRPPSGVEPEQCLNPAEDNGYCKEHDPESW